MAEEMKVAKGMYVIDRQDAGTLVLTEEVVYCIAGLAATEYEGVSSLSGHVTNDMVPRQSTKSLSKGVSIEKTEDGVRVDLKLYLRYGYGIPKTCAQVQDRVKTAIETMTGLTVSDINICIAGVDIDNN